MLWLFVLSLSLSLSLPPSLAPSLCFFSPHSPTSSTLFTHLIYRTTSRNRLVRYRVKYGETAACCHFTQLHKFYLLSCSVPQLAPRANTTYHVPLHLTLLTSQVTLHT
uniref:Secreted protein n=1 Tax=Trypanosoma vivax (strain Y486) TaxID=1055687 RepID=G0TZR5_TRYVY|nr:hypothetical protein TVY486_0807000 [Trypanosoma vivax Y486]